MSYRVFESADIAKDYALYRPSVPDDVVDAIIKKIQFKKSDYDSLAVDIACGSGQFTQSIARHFDRIIGFDISKAQIDEAKSQNQRGNVEYRISSAEKIPLESNTVDLVTVSQAAHWLDFPAFCDEADRVLRPGGYIVVVSSIRKTLHHDDPILEAKINDCNDRYMSVLNAYRLISLEKLHTFYGNLKYPYPETIRDTIGKNVQMSPADYLNLTKTMSYSLKYRESNPHDTFFQEFEKSLVEILKNEGENDGRFRLTFWYDMFIGQKGLQV
ncbi:putative methyltransferase DDB_G0268948 isoform X2 [Lytechinus variegatus]|uniref:putative methyltransferase DDB_G0268948 isoform X2 n=1 Tax=Lytechinus variegatus TaxID=7654 RepID=UPI001BB114B9|nr:putative methyltransferase DDB_G0268948 isoform X2 [Lytechinus variegatus]